MWDHNLGVEEVYRLSLGCGQESGNILRWFDLRNKVNMTEDEKEIKEPACSYRDGTGQVFLPQRRRLLPQFSLK